MAAMADSIVESVVEEVIKTVVENVTESTATNGTVKEPASPEGIALAYGSLVVMALIPIFVGSFRSITHQEQQKVRNAISFGVCRRIIDSR